MSDLPTPHLYRCLDCGQETLSTCDDPSIQPCWRCDGVSELVAAYTLPRWMAEWDNPDDAVYDQVAHDHRDDRCYREHGHHVSPHLGCFMR